MERIRALDIAKGFGIIMIVYAHTHAIFSDFVISVAIPLFFLISGFLHNQHNSFSEFFKKKFVRLYLPFICCNLVLPTIVLIKRLYLGLDIKSNLIYIFKILLTLEKDGFLFGATWFLGSLFVIALYFKLSEKIFNKNYLIIGLITIFAILYAGIFAEIDYGSRRTIVCSMFYFIGMLIKNNFGFIKSLNNKFTTLITGIILLTGCYYLQKQGIYLINYEKFELTNLITFILVSISFSHILYKICQLLEKSDKFFCFIGQNSIHILIWHFVLFEVVTAIILRINNQPLFIIEHLPHVITKNPIWLCIYFIFGLFGSILLSLIYKQIFKIFCKEKGIL